MAGVKGSGDLQGAGMIDRCNGFLHVVSTYRDLHCMADGLLFPDRPFVGTVDDQARRLNPKAIDFGGEPLRVCTFPPDMKGIGQ